MNKAKRESIVAVAVTIETRVCQFRELVWDDLAVTFGLTPDEVIEIRNAADKSQSNGTLDSR